MLRLREINDRIDRLGRPLLPMRSDTRDRSCVSHGEGAGAATADDRFARRGRPRAGDTVRALCGLGAAMLPITHGVSGGLETPGTSTRGAERIGSRTHSSSPVHVPSAGRVGAHARNPKQLTELLELRSIPGGSGEGRERHARRGSASRDPRQRPAILPSGAQTQPVASSSGRATAGGPAWREVRGGKLDFEGCRWFDHQVVAAVTVRGVSAIDGFFRRESAGRSASRAGGGRGSAPTRSGVCGWLRTRRSASSLSRSGCRAALGAALAAEPGGRVSESLG